MGALVELATRRAPVVAPPTVGVVFPGDPAAPGTWSGTPSGVMAGLRSLELEARAVIATPSPLVHRVTRDAVALRMLPHAHRDGVAARLRLSRAIARNTPALGAVYGRAAGRALARAGHSDGLIQIGTGYTLPQGHRIVTYEDMTIHQALAVGYPEWRALGRRAIARRLDGQRRAYETAFACCFTSWWAARSAIEDYGVDPARVHVAGVGRNHAVDPPADRDWSVPRFLFIGWEWERKNGPAVLRAFARLRREVPEATLDIVGRHPKIEVAGVHDHGILRLSVPEERRELEPLLRRATCFVMPSRVEPSAIAYVEAMHAGLPAIGTTVGGAGNLIGDGGCVVDPASDDALLAAMSAFAEPARAAATGLAARRRSALFTWPSVAARLLRALALDTTGAESPVAFVDDRQSPTVRANGLVS